MGISFPFRIGVKGGVVMSSLDETSVRHVIESMQQILLTRRGERGMHFEIYSDLDTSIFSPDDVSSRTLIEYQIRDAINRLEPRVSVNSVEVSGDGPKIYAKIAFTLKNFNGTYITELGVGESYAE
jgi:phage baseplate assembly protein W